MKPLQFDESLHTGIDDIDDHHRRLYRLANGVLSPTPGRRVNLEKVMVRLRDYTRYHFAAEEFLFDQLDYAGADAHRSWHLRLVDEMDEIARAVAGGGRRREIVGRLHVTMDEWVRLHIQGADQRFVEFLSRQRASRRSLLPTLERLLEAGFDASASMEMSVVYAEGIASPSEARARAAAPAY